MRYFGAYSIFFMVMARCGDSGDKDQFSQQWKSATPIQKEALLRPIDEKTEFIYTCMRGKDEDAVKKFLGNPDAIRKEGTRRIAYLYNYGDTEGAYLDTLQIIFVNAKVKIVITMRFAKMPRIE